MTKYIIRRLLQAIPVIFLISIVCFVLMLMAPGGPQAQFNQNRFIKPEQVDQWLQHWCLVRNPGPPDMIKEYAGWLGVWNCNTRASSARTEASTSCRPSSAAASTGCYTAIGGSRSTSTSPSST